MRSRRVPADFDLGAWLDTLREIEVGRERRRANQLARCCARLIDELLVYADAFTDEYREALEDVRQSILDELAMEAEYGGLPR